MTNWACQGVSHLTQHSYKVMLQSLFCGAEGGGECVAKADHDISVGHLNARTQKINSRQSQNLCTPRGHLTSPANPRAQTNKSSVSIPIPHKKSHRRKKKRIPSVINPKMQKTEQIPICKKKIVPELSNVWITLGLPVDSARKDGVATAEKTFLRFQERSVMLLPSTNPPPRPKNSLLAV